MNPGMYPGIYRFTVNPGMYPGIQMYPGVYLGMVIKSRFGTGVDTLEYIQCSTHPWKIERRFE